MPSELDISFEACRPIQAHAEWCARSRADPVTQSERCAGWPAFAATGFGGAPESQPLFALAAGERVALLRFAAIAHPQQLSGRTLSLALDLAANAEAGILHAILTACQAHLRRRGADSLYAEVPAAASAVNTAFRAAGFTSIGTAERPATGSGAGVRVECHVIDLVGARWRSGGVYVVAEAGSNWRMGTLRRDMAMARALIDVAVESGADAVKFQTYRAETVYVPNAGTSDYLSDAGITEDIKTIFDDLSMPYEMVPELAAYCERHKIDFMSTPFSPADFAAIDPHTKVHKVASYEISHVHLLRLAARSGKPTLLSTGASEEEDIAWAVETYHAAGGRDLCLLQCTAKYPAPPSSLNIAAIPWLRERFGVAAGLSDHSREPAVAPVMAVALGARVIEKHYTLNNALPGPDHSFALEPADLKRLVAEVRYAEQARGDGIKRVSTDEEELAAYARRGLQATRDIAAGTLLREGENFAVLRPGKQTLGLHPRHLDRVEGRRTRRRIGLGQGLALDDIAAD